MDATPLSLIDRLRRQPDEDGWRRLVDLYTPLIRGWIARFDVPDTDADDLVQEVLATLVREVPRFDHSGRVGAFRHWVRSIAVNRLRGYWRDRNGPIPGARDLEDLADPSSELARLWDREHDESIARRLMELIRPEFAPATWQSFLRQVIEGARPAEVAAELGLSVNAVLIAKSRVLRRLRQEAGGLLD